MTNLGVIGGTFDPVHLGHLAIAEEARRQFDLTEVVFVPAGHPYFKSLAFISPPGQRLKMLELALAGKPYFRISLIEMQRPGPSYTVDTISELDKQKKSGDRIFFIMGWDSLMQLPSWHYPQRLISLCRIVAAPRPGFPKPDVSLIEKELPGISQMATVMDKPVFDISATQIRERVSTGQPIDDLVPLAVARYIQEQGLYLGKG